MPGYGPGGVWTPAGSPEVWTVQKPGVTASVTPSFDWSQPLGLSELPENWAPGPDNTDEAAIIQQPEV